MEPVKGKKNILVVEDEPVVLEMIERGLKRAGYSISTASNGMEAIKAIESGVFDLLITDIVIPFVSGVGIITAFKKKHPDKPVIATTGFGQEPMEAAIEKKADLVIGKPFKMSDLKIHIENLFGEGVEK